jgi:hypothetical protein
MRVIDADGRLFGRVNLVDAAIGGFVVLLIPLAVAAALLFRPPMPTITSVEPAPLTYTEDRAAQGSQLAGKVKIRGTGFRPVMRVEIGGRPALAFIFENPSSADILFSDLPPGTHDLVLFDGRQELARSAHAVAIPEKPARGGTRVRVLGTYMDMTDATARTLQAGMKFPSATEVNAEIVALGDPEPARYSVNGTSEVVVPDRWQRRVLMALRCDVVLLEPRECRMTGNALVAPGHVLTVPGPGSGQWLLTEFVLPDRDPVPADMRVRFIGYAGVVDMVRVGDRDREHLALDGRGASITALGARRQLTGAVSVGLAQEGLGISADVQATDQVTALDATLRIGLDQSRTGWRYRTDPVRIGAPITLTTPSYVIRGVVLGIDAHGAPPKATDGANP